MVLSHPGVRCSGGAAARGRSCRATWPLAGSTRKLVDTHIPPPRAITAPGSAAAGPLLLTVALDSAAALLSCCRDACSLASSGTGRKALPAVPAQPAAGSPAPSSLCGCWAVAACGSAAADSSSARRRYSDPSSAARPAAVAAPNAGASAAAQPAASRSTAARAADAPSSPSPTAQAACSPGAANATSRPTAGPSVVPGTVAGSRHTGSLADSLALQTLALRSAAA